MYYKYASYLLDYINELLGVFFNYLQGLLVNLSGKLFVPVAEYSYCGFLRVHFLTFRNQAIPGGAGFSKPQ